MRQNTTWMQKYIKTLEGRTITATGVGADGFPWFRLDNDMLIEVSSDPEGNDAGFLFGLPLPPKQ